jgi:hypothetical protein
VWLLTSPKAKKTFVDWNIVAHDIVARWRSDVAKFPIDKIISNRIHELQQKSSEFTEWWAEQEVREHRSVVRRMCHPRSGVIPMRIIPMTTYYDATGSASWCYVPECGDEYGSA